MKDTQETPSHAVSEGQGTQHTGPADQARHLVQLIRHARERDELGKAPASRKQLVAALMVLGRGREEAEREVDDARRRVRRAADKAEQRLEEVLKSAKLWDWTRPRAAIHEMRKRCFGGTFDGSPLTDIEQAMLDKGNVFLIVAMYETLKWPILARLKLGSKETTDNTDAPHPQGTS